MAGHQILLRAGMPALYADLGISPDLDSAHRYFERVRFVVLSLLANAPNPQNGVAMSQHDKITSVVDQAELVEQLGYDAFQIGERHGAPFLCSSPPVLLTAVAARTRRIRLLTGVTVLSIHDPVRVAEDYALVDHLSAGRLELVIGKGNHAPHHALFGLEPAEQWDVLAERYELLRRLWDESEVTWSGRYRDALTAVTTQPRPFQPRIRIWHGSGTSRRTTELAARHGDPLYSANGFFPVERYRTLIDHYRERWAHYGHSGEPLVGSGFPALLIRRTSQEALEAYRPIWNAQRTTPAARYNNSPFWELEEFIEQGSALVGSPQQVLDKVARFTELYGQELTGISVDLLPLGWQREQLAWFAADIAPELRRAHPSGLWRQPSAVPSAGTSASTGG
jgi:alkanesulfonate monooxygenase SsuD/methylene tetrahydromethanopterin reductase-like flavin-dependent oxidoreductase (luciferase family)